jgi:hypothetical protein
MGQTIFKVMSCHVILLEIGKLAIHVPHQLQRSHYKFCIFLLIKMLMWNYTTNVKGKYYKNPKCTKPCNGKNQ